uniref:ZP domain-containing protein n=1 Tax=Loa loa TaxID=7209 RepID=A0A1I7VRY3_LOALO
MAPGYVVSNDDQLIKNISSCVIDHTLMEPLIYNDDLTVAHSVVPAFKFADQLTIRFQCKVTLCNKSQSGCEGISPPNCEIVSTSTSTTELSETVSDGSTSTAESSETIPDGSTSTAESSETVPDGPTSTTEPPTVPDGPTSTTEPPTVPDGPTSTTEPPEALPDGSTSATESTSDSNESEENSNESEDNIDSENSQDVRDTSKHASKLSAVLEVERMSYRRKRFLNGSGLKINPLSLSQKFRTEANSTNANRFTLDVVTDQLVIFERDEMNQIGSPEVSRVSCEQLCYSKRMIKCGLVSSSERNAESDKFEGVL